MSSQYVFAEAADALASSVLGALSGAGDTVQLARHIDDAPDALAALAAIRVIGADTFAPHLLAGNPFHAQDAAVVAKSFEAFPAAETGSPAPSSSSNSAPSPGATGPPRNSWTGSAGTARPDRRTRADGRHRPHRHRRLARLVRPHGPACSPRRPGPGRPGARGGPWRALALSQGSAARSCAVTTPRPYA
ncbi:hypothetical protein NKH18_42790 [Streptomyces sp. M10(2022)]